ncbi:MAG: sigma-70 family RNA polymerase sigma factor [Clostridia bacterium]|nr:sigma-70 family RNA polymerase sigma factor [Clostridia bacterium]
MLAFYLSLLDSEEEKSKFTQLYKKYGKLMMCIANQKLHDSYLAEDAVHDAFIKLTRYINTIGEVDSCTAKRFVCIVTECVATDMLRKDKHYPRDNYEELESTIAYEEDALDRIAVQELADIIAHLPETYRVVLELRAYHALEEKQIADVLGISYAATRKRLERARSLLSQKLREEDGYCEQKSV